MRKIYKINRDDWKEHGSKLQLRTPEVYLVTPEVTPGYEWVLDHPDTFAVEKIDGSNVGVLAKKGRLVHVQNRENVVDLLQVMKGKTFIMEGIFQAIGKGYIKEDGLQYGELLGPKLQSNPYKFPVHIWYPFEKARHHLRYKSFDKYPRSFLGWSAWFETGLLSLLAKKQGFDDFAEGVIFCNYTLGSEGKPRMAKMRRSMFWWYYLDKIRIEGPEDFWAKT